jgi:hypothetical protein
LHAQLVFGYLAFDDLFLQFLGTATRLGVQPCILERYCELGCECHCHAFVFTGKFAVANLVSYIEPGSSQGSFRQRDRRQQQTANRLCQAQNLRIEGWFGKPGHRLPVNELPESLSRRTRIRRTGQVSTLVGQGRVAAVGHFQIGDNRAGPGRIQDEPDGRKEFLQEFCRTGLIDQIQSELGKCGQTEHFGVKEDAARLRRIYR